MDARTVPIPDHLADQLASVLTEAEPDHPWPELLAGFWIGKKGPTEYVRVDPKIVAEIRVAIPLRGHEDPRDARPVGTNPHPAHNRSRTARQAGCSTTPFYALDPADAAHQLDELTGVLGCPAATRLRSMLDELFAAMAANHAFRRTRAQPRGRRP